MRIVPAVLFDLDGTLVDSAIDFRGMRATLEAIARREGAWSDDMGGLDLLGMVEAAHARLSGEPARATQLKKDSEAALVDFEMAAVQDVRLVPGADTVLEALRGTGVKTAIVTRNCRRAVEEVLRRLPLPIDCILTRSEVPYPKPHPDHLQRAMDTLGVKASQAWMVGDHWLDVAGGRAAGARTVGFLRPGHPRDWFDTSPPDAVIQRLEELMDLIEDPALLAG